MCEGWRVTANQKDNMKTEYIITSRPGMTPFARTTSERKAQREARKARRLGLDGQIVRYASPHDIGHGSSAYGAGLTPLHARLEDERLQHAARVGRTA